MAIKTMLLAAALSFGGTAVAQDMTAPAPAPATTPAPAPAPAPAAAPTGQTQTMTAPDGFQGKETPGGYEPANPPLSAPAQPGQQVQFVPAPPVAQAYPAPAAQETYPICKKGQTDKCRQRGG